MPLKSIELLILLLSDGACILEVLLQKLLFIPDHVAPVLGLVIQVTEALLH